MLCSEIITQIEKTYPKAAALGFDNVGLLAGRRKKEVKRILLALDATDAVVEKAVQLNVDLLITHHPLIFSAMKSVTDEDFIGRRVLKLIQKDISYYAMHTNYDVLGMADLVANILELQNAEVLDVTWEKDGKPEGIGRIGTMPRRMNLEECCCYVKEQLHLEQVKVFGNPKNEVCRMAVSPGSGKSAVNPAVLKGADVLVTGDIGHHEGLDALEQDLAVIDAGHYGTEYFFIRDMEQFLKKELAGNEIEILTEESGVPFRIV